MQSHKNLQKPRFQPATPVVAAPIKSGYYGSMTFGRFIRKENALNGEYLDVLTVKGTGL